MKTLFLLLTVLVLHLDIQGQSKFQNDKYGFSGQVPADWRIYAEIKDNPSSKSAVIDWALPRVYSELERTYIENAVSITAYRRPDIKSIGDLIKLELERVSHILVSKELIDSSTYTSYILITSRIGLKYKTKVTFIFKNNIGFVLAFTATPGTYDINLSKFDSFVKDIQFTEPKEQLTEAISKTAIRFDGLYVVKTGEINNPNNKMEIYAYIRFYDDGTVYTQSVNSYDPEKISKWFGKNGKFERKGEYKTDGADISFMVTNDESDDKHIEGVKSDKYNGKITDENKLFLEKKYDTGEFKDFWFEFVKLD